MVMTFSPGTGIHANKIQNRLLQKPAHKPTLSVKLFIDSIYGQCLKFYQHIVYHRWALLALSEYKMKGFLVARRNAMI